MRIRVGVAIAAGILSTVGVALGQECDTFDVCMAGMCQGGACVGVPVNGGACDDFNPCTTNDTCVSGTCQGSQAEDGSPCTDFNDCTANDTCVSGFCAPSGLAEPGTRCTGGCGTCQFGLCMPDPEAMNDPCTPIGAEQVGPCLVGKCMPQFGQAFCLAMQKTCPDDGNKCTGEFCNPETGDCESSPLPARIDCFPAECHRCVPSTGACEPTNVGGSCDDFNVCTASTVCSATGTCVSGAPQQTATATRTPGANTPTPTATATVQSTRTNTVAASTATPSHTPGTPTATPTQGRCVGDCDHSGQVSVNELITGVNIALDRAAFEQCEAFDLNDNSDVEVDELVAGVNSSIRGCVGASALSR